MKKNPFRAQKYEDSEINPMIWVSPLARSLEQNTSFYISGSRGSGKTTLLRSIHWRERIENEHILSQFEENEQFSTIGVYLHVAHFLASPFGAVPWEKTGIELQSGSSLDYQFFSIYIETMVLRYICDAFDAMRANGFIDFSPSDEDNAVLAMSNIYSGLDETLSQYSGMAGLPALSRAFKHIADKMKQLCFVGGDWSFVGRLPFSRAGELLREGVLSLRRELKVQPYIASKIKVMLDDAHLLDDKKQIYVNSIVRHSRAPVFWIVSYIRQQFQNAKTIWQSEFLTSDDRRFLDLDAELRSCEGDFLKLCESVTRLRLDQIQIGKKFDLTASLGNYSVNELIHIASRGSINPKWKAFRSRADQFSKGGRRGRSAQNRPDVPSYYEAYLTRKILGRSNREGINWDGWRKKERAALLCICREYRFKPPYAGINVVAALSDGCIRDYLNIMAGIYDEFFKRTDYVDPEKFCLVRIDPDLQRDGIIEASRSKFLSIEHSLGAFTSELSRLVECLGHLTMILQSTHTNNRCLRNPERGIFSIFFEKAEMGKTSLGHDFKMVREVINEGLALNFFQSGVSRQSSRGFNVSTNLDGRLVEIRLHRRFAPHFKFSYRGAFAPVRVNASELIKVCKDPGATDAKKWAERIASIIDFEADQVSRQHSLPLYDIGD